MLTFQCTVGYGYFKTGYVWADSQLDVFFGKNFNFASLNMIITLIHLCICLYILYFIGDSKQYRKKQVIQ